MNLTQSEVVENGLFRDSVFLFIYFITVVVALIGNSIVVKVVFTIPRMRTFVHILLANMAISDILCGLSFLTGLILCFDQFMTQFGNGYCVANKAIQLLSFQVSSVTITIVAIDRWISVFFPFYHRNNKKRLLSVSTITLGVWIVSAAIIIATSPSLGFQRYFNRRGPLIRCELATAFDPLHLSPRIQRLRLVAANLAHFWIPLIIICIAYGSISFQVCKRQLGNDLTKSQKDVLMIHKWKTIKMLIAAVGVFLICWLPFFIMNIIAFMRDPSKKRPCQESFVYLLAIWLAFSSCSYNPFIYWIYNDTYRSGLKQFMQIFRFRCLLQPQQQQQQLGAPIFHLEPIA